MSLSATIKAGLSLILKGTAVLGGQPTLSVSAAADIATIDGVAANKMDMAYVAELSIANGAPQTIVLSDDSLTDPVGDALTFVKVRAMYFETPAANGGNVEIGGAASFPFVGLVKDGTDKIVLRPGERLVWEGVGAGIAVGSGSSDQIKFHNTDAGANGTLKVVIAGTSA